ncbi:MAG: pre-peptidase C-terminal domain-containing protein [Rhodopirellula sp.]|nr:pre-peptidase C-terminal domain-containing protein [Rhodopirellula sp.]
MKLSSSIVVVLVLAAVSHSVPPQIQAETKIGFRQLTIVEPVAVQRGVSQQVTLRSNFTLNGTHSVFFDQPGVTMTFAEKEPKEATRSGRGSDGTPFAFDVVVSADAQPGVRELRVATDQAVSSVSHLMVTDYPVFREDEKKVNGTRDQAAAVTLPVAICGRVERAEDVDFYSFEGKAGQEITAELFAQRATASIHGMVVRGPLIYLMDGLMTLYGPNGQVVAQNDNFYGGDSLIGVTLPEDGTYCLEVRDARYAGSGRYVYCVELASRPYAYATFPLSVQRGTTTTAVAIGQGLGESTDVELRGTTDAGPGIVRQRLQTGVGETNPVSIIVSEHPQIVADGKNVSLETAHSLTFPIGINGRFPADDGVHYYSFDAKKGDAFLFEVTAQRLGLPLDCVLEVYDSNGKLQKESDDYLQSKDSKFYWNAAADGQFFLSVRDLHGRGGERFLYHLSAERSGQDFELSGEYYYAQLAPGTNMIWFAKLNRINAFDGPVEIIVEGLPAGVEAEPLTIPKGMVHGAIILKCAPDAKINASLVRVSGRATITDADGTTREVVHRGLVTCEQQSSGGGQARWPISTQIVGVTKPLDLLKVEASPNSVTLKPGEKQEITVRIERQDGFTDPVTLAMSFDYFTSKFGEQLPPGVTVGKASTLRLAGKVLEGKVILEASDKALAVEKLPIAVLAWVSITFSITTNYASNPIHLTVLPKE